ncbi:hypothetical protein BU24DRAFT_370444 [Aaosphaeria arxii CBS 175.79]|uniref:C2H2-type domain-containing protein n=1 Tax=Aaosphaeria arxii CBS 175.79 TaxID=1450172 RepID=A0A6A5XT88_9PLEO|nr:uncharacterized protein BU24DRAFT_370444 [Aaosphaeria arxii CBS 175.79]KAF2016545.1 hypothetical protein BU24DRAFT_370444 [Aaosphaeria arxii CBS 175.79]
MADSDYDYEEDASDDEYLGGKGDPAPRTQEPRTKKKNGKAPAPARKRNAWESSRKESSPEYEAPVEEAEDGTIQQSIQEREEERKRKRLRKDTKPFQRGIIRHVVLVLDLSEAMAEKDMRPNRYITMIKFTQDYVREFFEQNPISQMSVLGMHDGLSIRVYAIPHTQPWNKRGYHSLRIIGMGARLKICQEIVARTNAGDESEYTIATDQELLRELLLATTTPPVVRNPNSADAAQSASSAALMMMGFPSRVVEDTPTMCACHGNLTTGGYTCSRCSAKVCSLPTTCPSCSLTLLLSTHLARSYHHLFPLRNWREVSWKRAREKESLECTACLCEFPEPPTEDANGEPDAHNHDPHSHTDGAITQVQPEEDESIEQKASESSRYECMVCESHFCVDCDMFCHMVLHNCPGCLSQLNPAAEAQNGEVQENGDMSTFERLIRFQAEDGQVRYGNLTKHTPTLEIQGSKVEVLEGDVQSGFKKTGAEATVSKLLAPLPRTNIVMCIGLNYRHHAEEANLEIPKFPTVFTKPPDALAGPLDDIPIHPDCQSMLDYEGELTVVIGKDAKNVTAADAYDYILGYTVGNDVSARNFQLPASVSGGQFGYAKSFDKFAPIGPAIVSTSVIPDPQKLKYTTKVNGEVRQQTGTDDMIYSIRQIVEHLSRGTTLRAGTVIMTGTPSGVGLFMDPKGFVKDGDVVEIEVEGIGSLKNTMRFEK